MTLTLVDIGGGHRLHAPAAASYARCREDGAPQHVTSSWRSRELQQRLRDGWLKRLPGYNFALDPDESEHVAGNAIDVPEPARAWFHRNGRRYGWIPNDPNEPWHFVYRLEHDTQKGRKPRPVTPVKPAPTEEDDDVTAWSEAPESLTGVAAEKFGKRFTRDQLLGYAGLAYFEARGADAAIEALAKAVGLDGRATLLTVREAVDKALADLSITLTTGGNQ